MKINSQRLSNRIMSKDQKKAQEHLVALYGLLTPQQRNEIKELFKKNAKKG